MKTAVKILIDAIAERGLSIRSDNGKAVIHGDKKEVTPELLAAMNHFRRELLEAAGITEATTPEPDPVQPKKEKAAPVVPNDAVIAVMDKDGYTDKAMRSKPYMWCWIGGETWYYVDEFPIPKRS